MTGRLGDYVGAGWDDLARLGLIGACRGPALVAVTAADHEPGRHLDATRPVGAPAAGVRHHRGDGVEEVVCQEKHMGSRAVALIWRTETISQERFGAPTGQLGQVWT